MYLFNLAAITKIYNKIASKEQVLIH